MSRRKYCEAIAIVVLAAGCEDFYLFPPPDRCSDDSDCPGNQRCVQGWSSLICEEAVVAELGLGSCRDPFVRVVPFTFERSTDADAANVLEVPCSDVNPGELVIRVELPRPGDLHVTASDESAQAIAVALMAGACDQGAPIACASEGNGVIDTTMRATQEGEHFFIVERNPPGPLRLEVSFLEE